MSPPRVAALLVTGALLALSPDASAQERATAPRDRTLVWTGIAMTGAGAANVVGGTLMMALWKPEASCRDVESSDPSQPNHYRSCQASTPFPVGALLLAGGSLLAAIGVPLWLVGAGDARTTDGDRPSVIPDRVVLGAGSGAVHWSF